MQELFLKRKLIDSICTDPFLGSFSTDAWAWKTCREEFAPLFTKDIDGFYFRHSIGKAQDVAAFIRKTELIVKQSDLSSFALTNRDSILWVEPSNFWKSCAMRRSLLTLLLRAGMLYDTNEDNYEVAIFNEEHLVAVPMATKRFLYGFTKYIGPSVEPIGVVHTQGWKYTFVGMNPDGIKQYLVSEESTSRPTIEGCLWN